MLHLLVIMHTTRRHMPGRRKLLIVCFYSQMCLRGTCTHRVAPTQGRKKWANIRTRSARGSDICWMQLPRVGWLSKVARLPAFYDKLPDSSDCFCHFYPLKGTAAQRCCTDYAFPDWIRIFSIAECNTCVDRLNRLVSVRWLRWTRYRGMAEWLVL